MLKRLLNFKIICLLLVSFFWLNSVCHADDLASEDFYPNKVKLVEQQINLLKTRLTQMQSELQILQKQQDPATLSIDHVNKQLLDEAELDIAVAKSNFDSIYIELNESQQATNRLEKDIQEIQNQLNVFNIFGIKIARNGAPNLEHLKQELANEADLLKFEKVRVDYLQKLQIYADNILQLYKARHIRVESILKSQTMLLLKEQQAKTEFGFEQQQSIWLQQLNDLKLQ